MRYASRDELLSDIKVQFVMLCEDLDRIPRGRYVEPGVWGDNWTVDDLLAHLSAWHRLFLGWYSDGVAGKTPQLPAPGYKWNETPRLNREIWQQNRDRPTNELRHELERSHAEVLDIAEQLSADELFRPGALTWTGKNALVTYLGANTSSHYRFARKVLKRWAKAGRPNVSTGRVR
jgi:hypothetical protein